MSCLLYFNNTRRKRIDPLIERRGRLVDGSEEDRRVMHFVFCIYYISITIEREYIKTYLIHVIVPGGTIEILHLATKRIEKLLILLQTRAHCFVLLRLAYQTALCSCKQFDSISQTPGESL